MIYQYIHENVSWNIRGAGRRGIEAQIRDLIKFYNLDIIISMGKRVNSNKAQQSSQFKNSYIKISSEGFLGGLWLLQLNKDTLKIEIFRLVINLITEKYKID